MNICLKDFEGPLDLLLHLVKIKNIDLIEVNIRDIIDKYIEFISSVDKNNIDLTSEYLVMASELLHLKSKILLNIDEDDEKEEYEFNSEEDLREKLINYEKYKNVCNSFKILEDNRKEYFTKLPESLKEYESNEKIINSDLTINDLINAFIDMQKRINYKKPINTKITRKEYSISSRINEIRGLLSTKSSIVFDELFTEYNKPFIVVTFLSLLDMSKGNEIKLKQDKVFSKLYIEKR